jgi:polysaccharide export outer membrane protein
LKCALLSAQKPQTFFGRLALLAFMAVSMMIIAGCQTSEPRFTDEKELMSSATNVMHTESIVLREGDVLKLTFPSAANLNTPSIPIMRDGTVTLPLVGVVRAAGKTPAQLQDELVKLYSNQIESKQITVELLSAGFPVFVTGAVLKPGKVEANHPITALEAIMEAGGPDYTRANLKSITVLRREGGHIEHFGLNLKKVISGDGDDTFYMKPGDIIYVRERFSWF